MEHHEPWAGTSAPKKVMLGISSKRKSEVPGKVVKSGRGESPHRSYTQSPGHRMTSVGHPLSPPKPLMAPSASSASRQLWLSIHSPQTVQGPGRARVVLNPNDFELILKDFSLRLMYGFVDTSCQTNKKM